MTDQKTTEEHLPEPQEFIIHTPLYKPFKVKTMADAQNLWDLEYYDASVDVFCIDCGKTSVFSRIGMELPQLVLTGGVLFPCTSLKDALEEWGKAWPLRRRAFTVEFECSRNAEHRTIFHFIVHGGRVSKIGQHPSIADISLEETRQYRSVLGSDRYREFTRAIGLVSHGVGIGSFVYLRRIFESLIEEAHSIAKTDPSWDNVAYERSRVDEKISLLHDHLPSFLVENKQLYGILSKGIHALSEDECLAFFEPIKLGIVLILDQRVLEAERRRKEKEARVAIQKIHQHLKASDKQTPVNKPDASDSK